MAKATALAISLDSNFLSPEAKEKLPHSQNRFWQGLEPEDVRWFLPGGHVGLTDACWKNSCGE
ncbi:hypothetical protein EYZ11_011360 [Aspergillus tanneri]|uniref:Uncharacterized protein n=1 Tax=Aspergillus tanneri TaxID=1220188 RepID=A0A4S3J2Y9_9EURO|nr:hypothetical protein EYZ11_011360 [Aspergillus tanneri]